MTIVSAISIHTINLAFHWCQGMEDTQSMNKLIKLDHTIFLLIKQIKNLNYGDNLSFMSLSMMAACNVNILRIIRGETERYVYGVVRTCFINKYKEKSIAKTHPIKKKILATWSFEQCQLEFFLKTIQQ